MESLTQALFSGKMGVTFFFLWNFCEKKKFRLTNVFAYPIIIIKMEKVNFSMEKIWRKIFLDFLAATVLSLLWQARQTIEGEHHAEP